MVKILSIGIARLTDEEKKNNNGEPVILSQAFEVSEFGFFQRGGVREMLTFFTRTFVKRTGLGKRQCVEHEGHLCHVQILFCAALVALLRAVLDCSMMRVHQA